jgi:pimeloyl-ACP methyl ester carboxylesterase
MHREADGLPALLQRLELRRPILFGHSDGASIALIAAARHPDCASALILEAPHVFVEELTVTSIAEITNGYASNARLQRSLGRHHRNADATFRRWSDIWLNPAFRDWNITECLPHISAPALLFQGAQDEYGTVAQVDAIVAAVPGAERVVLDGCRHSPHRDARDAVLERAADFVQDVDGA